MKVSIIVPIYNAEKHLDKCVQSLLNQDFSDYEIILVNDGSKDNSSLLCHQYEKKYSNVRVIDQQNKKDGGARNAGLRIALGKYVLFVDSDDYIEPTTLKETYKFARENNYDVVYFSTIEEDENGKEIKRTQTTEKTRIKMPSWGKLIRKDYIPALFIENKYSNDCNFSMKLKNNGGKFGYLSDCYFSHYVQNNSSVLHDSNPQVDIDSIYCMNEYKEWLIKNNKYDEDEFYYLVFHEMLLSRAKHALLISSNKGKDAYNQIIDYCHQNISSYNKQPFYKQEGIIAKTLAFLFYHRLGFIYKIYIIIKGN